MVRRLRGLRKFRHRYRRTSWIGQDGAHKGALPTIVQSVQLTVVTNDIFTKEDAEFLTRHGALLGDRIVGVETGSCPILPFVKVRRTIRSHR